MKVCSVSCYIPSAAVNLSKKNLIRPSLSNTADQVNFCSKKKERILYSAEIKKIAQRLKKLGVDADLVFDGSEKNFLMASELESYFLNLKNKNFKIPKMSINFGSYKEGILEKHEAAATNIGIEKNKISAEIFFNAPAYKYKDKQNKVFRLKDAPEDTSFEIDFYHEFAHAYQGLFDNKNYSGLTNKKIDSKYKKEIKEKLGFIAIEDKAEFVAEYFAYAMTGKNINSQTLAEFYKKCGGPKID